MNRTQTRHRVFRPVISLGLVLFVVFLSGCEVLATEGARSAIAGQREVRALEDRELGPLEQELDDLFTTEIRPREARIEDLKFELEAIEEELLRPLWDAQNDAWAPGGEASEAQLVFEGRFRELELKQRAIGTDQRALESKWQNLMGGGPAADSEFRELEDLRYDKQRELEQLYRFGNRDVEDIWNEINELNSNQNWDNTGLQIRSDEINAELRGLNDRFIVIRSNGGGDGGLLEGRARAAQDELDALHNRGWDPIYVIKAEIERLEGEQASSLTTAGNDDSIRAQIAELERQIASYIVSRDAEIASLEVALAAAEAESTTDVTSTGDNEARIAELEQLIADLEAQSADLLASKQSEIDSLNAEIEDKKASYGQLIDDARADFLTLSASLIAEADALDAQIAEVAEADEDGAADQIAELQAQKDALIAQEESEEAAMHDSVAQFESDRDAGVAEIQVSVDALEASIHDGLTDAIDAQIAAYQDELDDLRSSVDETVVLISNTTSSGDIQANIESTENYWNGLINGVKIEILELESQLGSVTVVDLAGARIHSLRLQATELELALNTKIANLEAVVNELHRQANAAGSGDSAGLSEVQAKIDALNNQLESVWQNDSSNGLVVVTRVQELEKQARGMGDEFQQKTRALEEELWILDDKLRDYYRGQETGGRQLQVEFEAENALLQQRRADIEEQRWAIELEARIVREEIEAKNALAIEEIRSVENGQVKVLKAEIRALELELRGFYKIRREIELKMDEARDLVEDKQREIEDNVLDLLEVAAGVAGDGSVIADAVGDAIIDDGTDAAESGSETTLPTGDDEPEPDEPEVTEPEDDDSGTTSTTTTPTN